MKQEFDYLFEDMSIQIENGLYELQVLKVSLVRLKEQMEKMNRVIHQQEDELNKLFAEQLVENYD